MGTVYGEGNNGRSVIVVSVVIILGREARKLETLVQGGQCWDQVQKKLIAGSREKWEGLMGGAKGREGLSEGVRAWVSCDARWSLSHFSLVPG